LVIYFDTVDLSPRVAVNKESIEYKYMTRVISSMELEVGKNKNKLASHQVLLACEVTAII
jgi:hypothetical protein